MDEPRRYFTPAEANAMLPRVEALVQAARTALLDFRREEAAGGADALTLRAEVLEVMERLEEMGVEVRGLDEGLVDFPALRMGREVCLCWKMGEHRIEWWHPTHTGFAGRQPLEGEDPGAWEWYS